MSNSTLGGFPVTGYVEEVYNGHQRSLVGCIYPEDPEAVRGKLHESLASPDSRVRLKMLYIGSAVVDEKTEMVKALMLVDADIGSGSFNVKSCEAYEIL